MSNEAREALAVELGAQIEDVLEGRGLDARQYMGGLSGADYLRTTSAHDVILMLKDNDVRLHALLGVPLTGDPLSDARVIMRHTRAALDGLCVE